MSEWQPIETAPKDGTEVLVFCRHGVKIAYWNAEPTVWDGSNDPCWTVFEPEDYFYGFHLVGPSAPTHWMPLPSPPIGESDE